MERLKMSRGTKLADIHRNLSVCLLLKIIVKWKVAIDTLVKIGDGLFSVIVIIRDVESEIEKDRLGLT